MNDDSEYRNASTGPNSDDSTVHSDVMSAEVSLELQDRAQYKQGTFKNASRARAKHEPSYYGTHRPLYLRSVSSVFGTPFFTVGPDYRYFLGLFGVFAAISLVMLAFVLTRDGEVPLLTKTTLTLCGVHLVVYAFTAMRNPGICCRPEVPAESDSYEDFENEQDDCGTYTRASKNGYCATCRVEFASGRVHCDVCEICIDGYDHHCPWTSKCIGKNNVFCFYIFLVTTLVFFACTMINVLVLAAPTDLI